LQQVYSVDWHPLTNKIISGAHDRNIYIWTYNEAKNIWEPGLVNFSTKISVSEVKWSIQGDKFVACSSRLLATGYYDNELNWWTCKSIREHLSFVSCARFDNSGLFLLSGSTDKKAYISSSYINSVDDGKEWEKLPFPKVLLNYKF
jgi:WD40 repeat protein